MNFINLENKKPKEGTMVLIKAKPKPDDDYYFVPYYVCEYKRRKFYELNEDGSRGVYKMVFEEADGEGYFYWDENEVVGWMDIRRLDSLEVK